MKRLWPYIACAAIAVTTLSVTVAQAETSGRARSAPTASAARPSTDVTRAIQARLASYGYTIVVDGIYGPQTTRVVKHWQKANGLRVDGVAGPDTIGSLKLDQAAVATVPAKRAPTPVASPPADAPSDVEAIIRDVWPDDIEDWAVRIATRESNLQPGVRNACCWGLFQIHWTAHRAWLTSDFGITSPEQLYDPRLNATVALTLYQATGPGPWDL